MSMSTSGRRPARKVLEGVPAVHFYNGQRCPEDVPFPSCIRAFLEYRGENLGCTHVAGRQAHWPTPCGYVWALGTSGAAFRLAWNPERWDLGSSGITAFAQDALEPIRRAFDALGYEHQVLLRQEHAQAIDVAQDVEFTEGEFRERVLESIGRGVPVIGLGVVGPPECCLITGYDDGGEVLIGWSFFQGFPDFSAAIELEAAGQFRKRGWFAETQGLILIGQKGETAPLRQTYLDALAWGLQQMGEGMVRGRHTGRAAYDAWARSLLRDEEFDTEEAQVLFERYITHFDTVGVLAECRWYGSLFLNHIAKCEPGIAEPLRAASACFAAEHDLMWKVWECSGGNGVSPEHVRKLAEPEVRRRIVPLLEQARDKDAEAAGHIARALDGQP